MASFTLQDRKITAHEQLYQDGVRRQERQLTYASWVPDDVTFAPKIIRRAPETGKVSGHPGRKSTGNLAERWGARESAGILHRDSSPGSVAAQSPKACMHACKHHTAKLTEAVMPTSDLSALLPRPGQHACLCPWSPCFTAGRH